MAMALWAAWNPYRAAALVEIEGAPVFECVICHFPVVLDDVVIAGRRNCVCLLCYERICGTQIQLTREYLRQFVAAANEVV